MFSIETIMVFAIGFLTAALISVALVPALQARTTRLTARRIDAATPASVSEMQAEKDRMRAECAIATRQLELSIEALTGKTAAFTAELQRQAKINARLRAALDEKSALVRAMEARESAQFAREKSLVNELLTMRNDWRAQSETLLNASRSLKDRQRA